MDKKEKNPSAQNNEDVLMKNVKMNNSFFTKKLMTILLISVILGGFTGYIFSQRGRVAVTNGNINSSSLTKGAVVGSSDTKIFKDSATGDLKGGGINGEGQFHLVRPGGESQNVYLTSLSVDLSKFVGKKVTVWGETQKAQYAGWLMDVGRVEVL